MKNVDSTGIWTPDLLNGTICIQPRSRTFKPQLRGPAMKKTRFFCQLAQLRYRAEVMACSREFLREVNYTKGIFLAYSMFNWEWSDCGTLWQFTERQIMPGAVFLTPFSSWSTYATMPWAKTQPSKVLESDGKVIFCSTSLPLTSSRRVWSTLSSLCLLF